MNDEAKNANAYCKICQSAVDLSNEGNFKRERATRAVQYNCPVHGFKDSLEFWANEEDRAAVLSALEERERLEAELARKEQERKAAEEAAQKAAEREAAEQARAIRIDEIVSVLGVDRETAGELQSLEPRAKRAAEEKNGRIDKEKRERSERIAWAAGHGGYFERDLQGEGLEKLTLCSMPTAGIYIVPGYVVKTSSGAVAELLPYEGVGSIVSSIALEPPRTREWSVDADPEEVARIRTGTYRALSLFDDHPSAASGSATAFIGDPLTVGVLSAMEQHRAERKAADAYYHSAAYVQQQVAAENVNKYLAKTGKFKETTQNLVIRYKAPRTPASETFSVFVEKLRNDDVVKRTSKVSIRSKAVIADGSNLVSALKKETSAREAQIKLARAAERSKSFGEAVERYEALGMAEEVERVCSYAAPELFQHTDTLTEAVRILEEQRAEDKAAKDHAKTVKKTAILFAIILALVIAAIFVFEYIVVPAQQEAQRQEREELFREAGLPSACEAGEKIELGEYEQDANETNGKEPIKWLVLDVEPSRVLLVSEKALDCRQWNSSTSEGNDWEKSDLYKWLNGEFKSEALPGYGGEVTLLSAEEAEEYFDSVSDRVCYPTQTAAGNGAQSSRRASCYWWLRSPGARSDLADGVNDDGGVSSYGYDVGDDDIAVRPALCVDL